MNLTPTRRGQVAAVDEHLRAVENDHSEVRALEGS
jgi:hypothetical protein